MEKVWIKHWPKDVPQSLAYPNIPLGKMLNNSTIKARNSSAIFFRSNQITYEELDDFVDRFGKALQELGVHAKDRIAIYLPNSPQFVIAYYAALRIGAVVVACSPLYKERELAYILSDSESRVLVYLDRLNPYVQSVKEKRPRFAFSLACGSAILICGCRTRARPGSSGRKGPTRSRFRGPAAFLYVVPKRGLEPLQGNPY